jgi:hypothetical protein
MIRGAVASRSRAVVGRGETMKGKRKGLQEELDELERTDPAVRAAKERLDDAIYGIMTGRAERIRRIYHLQEGNCEG